MGEMRHIWLQRIVLTHAIRVGLLAVCFTALACSCAPEYVPPSEPTAIALLVADNDKLRILSIDGLSTSAAFQEDGCKEVTVRPGEHTVVVRHSRNGAMAQVELNIDVAAGRRYVLKSRSEGYHTAFLVRGRRRP